MIRLKNLAEDVTERQSMSVRRSSAGFAMAIVCAAVAMPARGETGVVHTKDGRMLHGELTRTGDRLELVTMGKTHRYATKDVKSFRMDSEIEAEYDKRAATAKADDLTAQAALLDWTQEQGNPNVVIRQARAVLRLKTDHAEASELMRKASDQLKAEREAKPPPTQARPPRKPVQDSGEHADEDTGDGNADAPPGGQRKLDKKEINRLRYHELKAFREKARDPVPDPCTVAIPRQTVEDFLHDVEGEPDYKGKEGRERFLKLSPERKLAEIAVSKVAGKYVDKVDIKTDPEIFLEFKTKVTPIVMRGCASSNCHGGADAEKTGLRLFNDSRRLPESVYTNFLLLDEIEIDKYYMIDRGQPERSLLLTWMLPPNVVPPNLPKHPGDAKLKPVFQNTKNTQYENIRYWISGLRLPRPAYDVRLRATPATASAPADHEHDKMKP